MNYTHHTAHATMNADVHADVTLLAQRFRLLLQRHSYTQVHTLGATKGTTDKDGSEKDSMLKVNPNCIGERSGRCPKLL
eukprot:6238-Heterococcus_DN1.PRE.2